MFDKDTFGPLRVAGTDVCLDAAAGPGQALRTTPCENATTQTWYYYPDNTIALGLTSACLTVASGEFRPGAHVEAMRCQDTANSQVWTSD
ncbi:ricin-type beta-trefoil lectin domain protein [Streptomyces chartreusis]|uniref:ricin-type beta-trefoil lectin domain protein n=1 Tax=Streptomyces chartreusis TaxID=1969 RepID=UPI002E17282A